jgi:hypothetical protein
MSNFHHYILETGLAVVLVVELVKFVRYIWRE